MDAMAHVRLTDPLTLRSLCEWPVLIALLAVFGLAAFRAAVVPADAELESAPAELWTAIRVLLLIALAMAPLQFLTAVASMAAVPAAQALALTPQVMWQTRFGKISLANAIVLLMLAATAFARRHSRVCAALIAAGAAAALAVHAAAGHAVDYGIAAIAVYFVHEAAAGLWIGALAALYFLSRRTTRCWAACGPLVGRVSRLCGWCVAVLVASGVYIAWCGLGLSLDHLLYSAYGRTLLGKMSLFAILLAAGAYNRYWLVAQFNHAPARKALIRSVRAECLLMAAVVGLAVLLANTPPSH